MISNFWRTPYDRKLVRWGTELHDRFMLPHFVAQDFGDVIEDLNRAGISDSAMNGLRRTRNSVSRRSAGFAQRGVEFRVASGAGAVARHAGEEGGAAGTVRYVDSSLERIQVKVDGMTDTRHVAACNGRRIPLHPTGVNGQFVAGVRYRAWQPPNCLQPTIPVHAPLVIELVDTWQNRSIGGCTYHVAHPGRRSHDTFPVNSYEAESRRVARFFKSGHTPGSLSLTSESVAGECPFTLDLRRTP